MTSRLASKVLAAVLFTVLSACSGGHDTQNDSRSSWVLRWNAIAIDASGFDHSSAGGHEQIGPTRASRAMAMAHLAIFEAANAVEPRYRSHIGISATPSASMKAAIAKAGHDILAALYPSQTELFDSFLAEDLSHVEDGEPKSAGLELGALAARLVIDSRQGDGSELSTPEAEHAYSFESSPGHWRKDPINPDQEPLGSQWGKVRPFVLESASQFRTPPPPALDSAEYAEAYAEVFRLGGDGVNTPTERTDQQTETGIFWAYDGTPSLCAPPRMYNQIAVVIARDRGLEDPVELARYLALVNVSMADAGIASWESKFHYDFWRPVTAIRESDQGTGPTGAGDGNPLTPGDPSFVPLGAPGSNTGVTFTPPFPSYPSGHATFGGAVFQTIRNYFGTDEIPFTFVSDELNGETIGVDGEVRPLVQRSFSTLSQAEEENGQSRIYLGIHYSFDKTAGIEQGRRIADHVFGNAFQPLE